MPLRSPGQSGPALPGTRGGFFVPIKGLVRCSKYWLAGPPLDNLIGVVEQRWRYCER